MTAYDNISKARAIWELVLPANTQPPEDRTFHRWLLGFTIEEIEKAIVSADMKFSDMRRPFADEEVYRYVTARMVNFRDDRMNKQTRQGEPCNTQKS
jgi:hypothetical protein